MSVDEHHEGLVADTKRQAVASLDGYAYQIWHSVLDWLTLRDDEDLELEGNEDIDRLAPGQVTTTQVKKTDGSGAISLRSGDVADAINNFWLARGRNPDRPLKMRFLSTTSAAKEHGNHFDGARGLDVWQAAQRSTNDNRDRERAKLIRDFLMASDTTLAELKTWLGSATYDQILSDLIRPISWDLEAPPTPEIKMLIDEQLTSLGDRFGVLPRDAVRARPALLQEALTRATDKANRRLRRNDLLRVFQDATTTSVSASAAMAMQGQAGDFRSRSGAVNPFAHEDHQFDLASRSVIPNTNPLHIPRKDAVSRISEAAARNGFVYVSASTGMGKSSLLVQAIGNSTGDVTWIDLRDRHNEAKSITKSAARKLLASPNKASLVLDDLDFSGDSRALQDSVTEAIAAVRVRGGAIYATGAYPLPARILSLFPHGADIELAAPPLTDADVDTMLQLNGCGDVAIRRLWSKLILAYTRGHPQLVEARVRALRQKRFPEPSEDDLATTPPEVLEERAQARHLISTLPPADRKLLYRLSLVFGRFTRHLAITTGSFAPRIEEPGNALDRLVGPWVERLSESKFRVSPLAEHSGAEANGSNWAKPIHAELAKSLFSRSLDPDEANGVFFHALKGGDESILMKMSLGIITASHIDRSRLSAWIEWLIHVDPDNPESPISDPHVKAYFQLVQFLVAAQGRPEVARDLGLRLNNETRDTFDSSPMDRFIRWMILFNLLTADSVTFPVEFVVNAVVDFTEIADHFGDLEIDPAQIPDNMKSELKNFNPALLLAMAVTRRLKTKAHLLELFDSLEQVPPDTRRRMLNPATESEAFAQQIFEPLWIEYFQITPRDWEGLLEALNICLVKATGWGAHGLQVVLATCIVRILNENLKKHDEALATGQHLRNSIGDDPRLLDAIADVYDWTKQPLLAYELRLSVLDRWPVTPHDSLHPITGRKKAAIAAAQCGKWLDAADLFMQAAELAPPSMKYQKAGMLADSGHSFIRGEEKARGIQAIEQALIILQDLPNTRDKPREYRVHKTIGHLLNWLSAVAELGGDIHAEEPPPGTCSSLASNEKEDVVTTLPETPIDYSWLNLGRYAKATLSSFPLLYARVRQLRSSRYTTARMMAASLEVEAAILAGNLELIRK